MSGRAGEGGGKERFVIQGEVGLMKTSYFNTCECL